MKSLPRRTFAYAALALGIVLFVAVNIVSNMWLRGARLDLTEGGLYTVSDGTRATLARLQEPVTLRYFFSRDAATGYPTVNAYASRVRDLLNEYEAIGNGKIVFEEIDPVSFTPAEDQAVAAGLSGAQTPAGETVYFGLSATNTFGGRETIPFFDSDREEYLEYDITSLIGKLSTAQRPKLGVLSALPLETGTGGIMAQLQGNAQPLAIYQQLRETFDVQMLAQTVDRIPADVTTLLIAHPAGFSDRTLYAIDQFVLRGGRAILLVDPVSEIAGAVGQGMAGMGAAGPDPTSNPAPLLRAWGVDFDASRVVGDADLAQRVRYGNANAPQSLNYIVWLRLTGDNLSNEDPVTADLNLLHLASAGALKPAAGATTRFTPLMSSSANAALLDAAQVRGTQDPAQLLRGFEPAGGGFTLAARISGPARTAFPQGAPAAPPPAEGEAAPETPPEPLPAPIAEAQNINVLVVADSDLLDDRFWVDVQNILGTRVLVPIAENGALVINAVENMMGSSDLISLRTRAPAQRSFTVVDQMRSEADARFLQEEQQLQARISATEAQLRELEGQAAQPTEPGAPAVPRPDVFTPEQQETINRFRQELVETRGALRAVQANLRRDVENLGTVLTLLNIALVPILISLAAIVLAVLRRRRRMAARGI
jgi:ABC-type uncharacterized transport system involved in gliding motility auxiliary subunit